MAAESPHGLSHQLILGEVGLNGVNEVVGETKVREAIGADHLGATR